MSMLFICAYMCCRCCIICDVSNVVRAFACPCIMWMCTCTCTVYFCILHMYRFSPSLSLSALIGTKDPDQSFLLAHKNHDDASYSWINRLKVQLKRDVFRTGATEKKGKLSATLRSAVLFSPPYEWIFIREWQGAALLCDIFQNIMIFGEGRQCFFCRSQGGKR